jgi:PKD repeat protein
MPLEPGAAGPIQAQWSFKVVDEPGRLVAFHDNSRGKITVWKWDFGDGETSTDQHPQHRYAKGGQYIVTLSISGPDGQSRRAKVWDVSLP